MGDATRLVFRQNHSHSRRSFRQRAVQSRFIVARVSRSNAGFTDEPSTTVVNEQMGKIEMRKYIVMILGAGLMAFGIWPPLGALARPPQGSQARCFDNYAACYQNSGKCIFPGQCRAKCEQKYSACSAVATSGGWSSRGGSTTALPVTGKGTTTVTISSGGTLVSTPGLPATAKGTTAATISTGAAALVSTPNGKSPPVSTSGVSSTVFSRSVAPSSGHSTNSHSGGGGSLNGAGSGGPTKRKQL